MSEREKWSRILKLAEKAEELGVNMNQFMAWIILESVSSQCLAGILLKLKPGNRHILWELTREFADLSDMPLTEEHIKTYMERANMLLERCKVKTVVYRLTDEETIQLLKAGIRPLRVPVPKRYRENIAGAYALIPTARGEWIRQHAKDIGSKWEGSLIPLIIYRNGEAAIIVPHGEEDKWAELKQKLEEALKTPIHVRGD
jgi:hypothetical protein